MKKEVLFAIILGVVVGLVVMFGVYTANNALKRTTNQQETAKQTPNPDQRKNEGLTIISPEENLLTDKEKIQVTGTALPDATIVVFVNAEEFMTRADKTGNFGIEISLTAGSNVLVVSSIDKTGKQVDDSRTVVYSTANLDETSVATSSAKVVSSPSPSAKPKITATPSPTPKGTQ